MTSSKKPFIAITTVQTTIPVGDFQKPVIMANQSYVDLISDLGGIPILVARDPDVIERADGLLIIGGQDIDPAFWHAKPEVDYENIRGVGRRFCRPLDYAPNIKRDQFELALYKRSKERQIPIFGICRGLQLINVAEGGTLHQELPESGVHHETGADGWTHAHTVRIDPGSLTHKLMDVENYVTSSRHHQGIDKLGHGLKASAWADDDLIEVIESSNEANWIMAVQGHLEQTRANWALWDRLVTAFIERCRLLI